MSPIIIDKEEKSRQLAEAALEVFSRQGYAATSMQQIGEAAGVGKSTLYEYFDGKADVFIAAIGAWTDQIVQRMIALMEEKTDPIEKIRAAVELVNEIGSADNPALNRLFIEVYEQMIADTGVLHHRGEMVHDMSAGIRRILTDVILDGVSTGVFKSEIARDAERIAINLFACIDGLLLHNLLGIRYFDLKWQLDFQINTLIDAIRVDTPPADTLKALDPASDISGSSESEGIS
jgi:AcrR family transcriptional regulator